SPTPRLTQKSASQATRSANPPTPRSLRSNPSCSPPATPASLPASANTPPTPSESVDTHQLAATHQSAKYQSRAPAPASAQCAAKNPAPAPPPRSPPRSAPEYPRSPAAAPHPIPQSP